MHFIAISFRFHCFWNTQSGKQSFHDFVFIREWSLCIRNTFLVLCCLTALFFTIAEFLSLGYMPCRMYTLHGTTRRDAMRCDAYWRKALLENKTTSHLHNMRLRVHNTSNLISIEIKTIHFGFCAQFLCCWKKERKKITEKCIGLGWEKLSKKV